MSIKIHKNIKIIILLIVFAILLGYFFAQKEKVTPNQKPQDESTTTDRQGKIEISGVLMNDFLKESKASFITISQTKDFHIFYIPEEELFYISIVSYPYENFRTIAEVEFLTNLGIEKEEACKLNVDITTTRFGNPDKAGEVYGLSFCD